MKTAFTLFGTLLKVLGKLAFALIIGSIKILTAVMEAINEMKNKKK